MIQRKPATGPAESGDDFIGDEQHVIPVADLSHRGEVVRRRGNHAPRADDRLGDERGHGVRPFPCDRLFQRSGARAGIPVRVGRHDVRETRHDRLEHRVEGRHTGGAHCRQGQAVIAVDPGDDLRLPRTALPAPEIAGDLERRLVRLRAAGREIHAGEVGIGHPQQPLRKTDGGRVRVSGVRRRVRQRLHLCSGGLGQLGPAVAHIHVPQRRQPVEVLAAFGIPQDRAVPFHKDHRRLVIGGMVQGMNQCGQVGCHKRTRIHRRLTYTFVR